MARVEVPVDRGDVGVRIDRVLLRHLSHIPGVTRNRLQRLIDAGAVSVNHRLVSRASARVQAGDVVAVDLPDRKPRAAPAAEDLPLEVIYQDAHLLIVNKPPGQVSHPTIKHASGTLLNALIAYAAGAWTPSLVSRLDRGTSGLVLVARSKAMHTALQRLGNDNAIEKEYVALVRGAAPSRGRIDLALDRDPWDRRRVTVRDRGGVPSVTTFVRVGAVGELGQAGRVREVRRVGHAGRVAARVRDAAPGGRDGGGTYEISVLRCRLITGRMHQIRVHLAARGWPILGDATYGVKYPGLDRQALHAWRLRFVHPATGLPVEVTAPLPEDMLAVLRLVDAGQAREHGAKRGIVQRLLAVGDKRGQ